MLCPLFLFREQEKDRTFGSGIKGKNMIKYMTKTEKNAEYLFERF